MNRRNAILNRIFVVVFLAVSLLILIWIGAFRDNSTDSRRLTFRVESAGGFANITFEAGNQMITDAATVSTPWERRVTVASGKQVFVTAANPSGGEVSCTIRFDGQVWKKDKNTSPTGGVACAGIVP